MNTLFEFWEIVFMKIMKLLKANVSSKLILFSIIIKLHLLLIDRQTIISNIKEYTKLYHFSWKSKENNNGQSSIFYYFFLFLRNAFNYPFGDGISIIGKGLYLIPFSDIFIKKVLPFKYPTLFMRFKINKGLQIFANRRIENHLPLARVVRQELPLKEGQEKILLGIEAFSKLNKSIDIPLPLSAQLHRSHRRWASSRGGRTDWRRHALFSSGGSSGLKIEERVPMKAKSSCW